MKTCFLSPVLLLACLAGASSQSASAQRFEDRFDGLGQTGLDPIDRSLWDVAVHSRRLDTWFQLEPMQAAHGLDASPPPATHPITEYEDAVYVAREHLMTAINAESYGVIYLTPHALADWSQEECVVRFDVSTLRTSRRDWIDLWITPWDDNMILPLEADLPDLQGSPRRGIQFRMGTWNTISEGASVDWSHFEAIRFDNYSETALPFTVEGWESFVTPDARERQTVELRISSTRIRLGLPEFDFWWVDTPIANLGFDTAVVQFGHHSYNPMKPGTFAPIAHDTSLAGTNDPSPNSWHWDAFSIEPAIPFESIPGDRRFVIGSDIQPVTFAKPAPRDAFLRFAAHSRTEVSFDGGAFVPAMRQDGSLEFLGERDPSRFSSYWMPIPEGTANVRVRMTPEGLWAQYGFETMAKDFAIWHRPEVATIPGGPERQPGRARPAGR